jgi:eukaryotic-like serine/threonine-protein kinase
MVATLERLRHVLAEHYVIERELGHGGMAVVYLAQDLKHRRQVAIKVLRPELAESLGPGRFLREISIASQLTHPHIVPLYDSGSADGLLFYVMPYVAGESLRDRIHREGQLPLDDTMQIAGEVAEALAYAHSQGVIHRDIKPGNILLESGHAVIADFGLARAIHAATTDDLSSAGLALGTPAYMSPEQSSGRDQVDGRSDIYSLGCVLYEMLAGEPPFSGPSAQAIAAKHLRLPPPPLRTVRPNTPAPVLAVIERALEKVPADRFQTAGELARTLATLDAPASKQQIPRKLGLGVLLLVGAALLGMLLLDWPARGSIREASSPAATASSGNDPTHIAVLYFDTQSQDTTMRWVASGLTEDLIDQLGQVTALSVISANGVRPFRGQATPPDSIAKALSVGTLVAGTVSGSLERPRVTVRLIEPSGRQVDSKIVEAHEGNVLALRGELVQQVAEFLRQRLGRELKLRELRLGGNARAWVQVRRAEDLRQDARTLYAAGDTTAAHRTLDTADSLLQLAEHLDRAWLEPIVLRGWITADRIDLAEARTGEAITEWAPRGLALAEQALRRKPGYEPALELRGSLRMQQWLYSNQARPEDADAAERDLRSAAVPENPSRARAQSTLAYLLWRRGSFAEANLVARRAYEADAFLADAPLVLDRLFVTSLLLRRWNEASQWCDQGHRRFPDQWLFIHCRLTLLSLPAGELPDAERAWQLVAEMQRVTAPSEWASLAPRWRMLVASVLARGGHQDSARRTLNRAREAGTTDPELDVYEAGVRVLLGEHQRALALLERYLAHAPSQKGIIRGDPGFDDLHRYPRFLELTRASE